MRRLNVLILITLIALLSLPGLAAAQTPDQVADTPTPSPTALPALKITALEPRQVVNADSVTLSIYGSGFTDNCVVQIVGYGLLSTSLVNAGALTASLPAGVPPGTYMLRVSDGAGRVAEMPDALVVRAPAPVAQPTSPAPAGRPILTIRNYTVEPTRVKAGEEFVVTIEIYNNGSRAGENTMAVFPGGTFLPVGETGHMIWQLHINHTTVISQRMRAPETLSSGVHNVNIELSANDWEGTHYDYPGTVPVEVIGKPTPTGNENTGKPRIVIENVLTDPAVLVPGEPFSLTLALANRGNRSATNVFVTSASTEMAVPASGSDTVSTAKIAIDEVVTVTLPLILGNVQTGGRQNMGIKLEYSDYNGGSHGDAMNIGVDINTSLVRQPQLIIESYITEPDFLSPGDAFTLTLRISNVGGGDAGRLTIALGGEEGVGLAPFIPLKSGNVLFVSELLKGDSVTLSRELIVDGSADAKAYSLPIALAYDDPRASRQEEVQRLSIIVRKRPEIQASFYRPPDLLMVGMPMPVALEVVNVGRSGINVSEMTAAAEGVTVSAEGIPFIGPLDPGGSAPLDLLLIPEAPGPTELIVSIRYRDEFNQVQVITGTLPIEVMESPEGPDGPGGVDGPWGPEVPPEVQPETFLQKLGRALRGFFGLGS